MTYTPEQRRIKIAEACDWKLEWEPGYGSIPSYGSIKYPDGLICRFFPYEWAKELFLRRIPDYLKNLNAMHSALKSQTQAFRAEFDRLLHAMAEEKHLLVTELEAKDWADCFISCLQSQRGIKP